MLQVHLCTVLFLINPNGTLLAWLITMDCHSQALIKCWHLLVKALPLHLCPQPHLPGLLPSLSSQPTLSLAAAAPDCSNSVSLAISVMEAVKKDEEGFLFSETTYNWECRETAIKILPFPCPLSISF